MLRNAGIGDFMRRLIKVVSRSLKWLLWDLSGLHFIWNKIVPPREASSSGGPPTITIWLVGVYVALFTISSQRYENRVSVIENRATSIFTQLGMDEIRKGALSRVPSVQNMTCPNRPEFLRPASVVTSLFGQDTRHLPVVEALKQTCEDWRDHLHGVNLSNADLAEAHLVGASLEGAVLIGADLRSATLDKANLKQAIILGANFKDASFMEADLRGVVLHEYDKDSPITWKLTTGELRSLRHGASVRDYPDIYGDLSNEEGHWSSTMIARQLSQAKTLYKVSLSPFTERALATMHPELFASPFPSSPKNLRVIPFQSEAPRESISPLTGAARAEE